MNPDRNFAELRAATHVKETTLQSTGNSLIIIWECEWDKQVKTDPELQAFLADLELVAPLEPRDAFFGGRTNTATLHAEADESKGKKSGTWM